MVSLCSGLETPLAAMKALEIEVDACTSMEKNIGLRNQIRDVNTDTNSIYVGDTVGDIMQMDPNDLPNVQFLVADPPLFESDWSSADAQPFVKCVTCIKMLALRVNSFLVAFMLGGAHRSQADECVRSLADALGSKWAIYATTVNSCDHGLSQNRERTSCEKPTDPTHMSIRLQ
eukprot:8443343-Pyramimonas_sp.AAC.1